MRHRIRLDKIGASLPQEAAFSPWDLSLLPDETLEALKGLFIAYRTEEELMAMIPEEMLKELERCYRGQDEQA